MRRRWDIGMMGDRYNNMMRYAGGVCAVFGVVVLVSSFACAQEADLEKQETSGQAVREELLDAIDLDGYFDLDALSSSNSRAAASPVDDPLRVMSPEDDQAHRFVVVNKDHHSDSLQARLIGAKRASDLGRYDSALLIYERLLEMTDAKDGRVLIGYAAALQNQGRDDEAIETYETLLEIEPDNIDAHINMLGLVAERYPAVALQRLKALDARTKNFNLELVGQVAFVQAQLGRHKEALEAYGLIAAREPHNPQHLLNMAIVADTAGIKAGAIEYYEKALHVDTVYAGGRGLDRDLIFDRLAELR